MARKGGRSRSRSPLRSVVGLLVFGVLMVVCLLIGLSLGGMSGLGGLGALPISASEDGEPEGGTGLCVPSAGAYVPDADSPNLTIVRIAYDTVKAKGGSDTLMLATFETALVESGFRNLASQKRPASIALPNDGVAAGDHTSVGVMQQQDGWGSVAERMDPAWSIAKFVDEAAKLETPGLTAGVLAARTQRPAAEYRGRYGQEERRARALIASAAASVSAGAGATVPSAASPTVACGGSGEEGNGDGEASARGSWVMPNAGPYLSGYGMRGGRMHQGIDLSGACGSPVLAAGAGTVIGSAAASGYGWLITVDHGGGVVTRYGHSFERDVEVRVGQRVRAGQEIAVVGNNGNVRGSTGCHLHFEVRSVQGGRESFADPARFLCSVGLTLRYAGSGAGYSCPREV